MMKPVTHEPAENALTAAAKAKAKRKKERRERWGLFAARLRLSGYCLVGVVAFESLDLAGRRIDFQGIVGSWEYLAFAVLTAALGVAILEKQEIPEEVTAERRRKILRRLAQKAVFSGLASHTIWAKVEELIG